MKKVVLCVVLGLATVGTGFLIGRLGGQLIMNILNSDNNETKTEEAD